MTSRRAFVLAAAATLGASRAVAQQAPRRIGLLLAGYEARHLLRDAFRDELGKLGWAEGRNLGIEYRYAEGRYERLPSLAADLVRARVELIGAGPSPAAVAMHDATKSIPIVLLAVGDPVGLKLVASLARPGGNVTGTAFDVGFDVFRKQLELLREAVQGVQRVAVLINPANPGRKLAQEALGKASSSLGLALATVEVRGPEDFDAAFGQIASARVGALLVVTDAALNPHAERLIALADRQRLPSISTLKAYVEAGGMIAYGPSFEHLFRRSALYVDRILKGAKPADLPVEQPTQFELAVNLAAAKKLGLTLPPALLSRADFIVP